MKLRALVCVAIAPIALVACGGSSSSTDTTVAPAKPGGAMSTIPPTGTVEKTFTIGTDTGKDVVFEVKQGDNVKLTFVNNEADDEVHVHDYDITTGEMKKGVESSVSFTADKAGDFEIESHVSEELLLTLRVTAQ
jgi:FtsP/CotA-like multicopper oxidase with cupredoxin domain